MDTTNSAILVEGLTKSFGGFRAVDSISFAVRYGEIFGFLGPNGAGKTTTMKSVLRLFIPDNGTITINGIDMQKQEKQAKKYIGYLPEKVAFYDNLTALQNMYFYAEMKGATKEQCKTLITEFGLEHAMKKKVGKFSKGMQQRLGMARAIIGDPPLLILDEPSGGLDPRGVVLIRNKIREMKHKGSTVFVSSHILSEIQEVCDRVGIINKGQIVAKDSVSELGRKLNLKPKMMIDIEKIPEDIINAAKKVKGVDSATMEGKQLQVVCGPETKAKVIVAIEKAGGNITNFKTLEPSLEQVFLHYTEEE